MTFSDILSQGFAFSYLEHVSKNVMTGTATFLFVLAITLCCVIGYLIGSINFAIIISSYKHDDVRNHGSNNAGATNMLRTYGKKAALLTFLGDFLKAIVACFQVKGQQCFLILTDPNDIHFRISKIADNFKLQNIYIFIFQNINHYYHHLSSFSLFYQYTVRKSTNKNRTKILF